MRYFFLVVVLLVIHGCKNKDINEGEEFRPRPVQDNFDDSHFTKVTVDGVEYIMMERDNNNPHEGFGFMAFRANNLLEKQDSIFAYLKAMQSFQNKIYSRMYNISEEQAEADFDREFQRYLFLELDELNSLEREELVNRPD